MTHYLLPAKNRRGHAIIPILAVLLFGMTTLSSCYYRDDDYYTPEPAGYQHTFHEEFSNDQLNWYVHDPANNAYVTVANGVYKISFHAQGGTSYSSAKQIGYNPNRNFLIQTSIRSDNAMGLLFGGSGTSKGYSFFIDDQGYFALYNEGSNGQSVTTILDWQYSNAIKTGWNDIEFEQLGDYWLGYVNGVKVFELQKQYVSGSRTGFIVLGQTTGYADYLTVQY